MVNKKKQKTDAENKANIYVFILRTLYDYTRLKEHLLDGIL